MGIGIGEGLTAFALPHHRAYGSVHGGLCSLTQCLKLIQESQVAPFGKETIGQGNLQRFHVGQSLWALVRSCRHSRLILPYAQMDQVLITGMAVVYPLLDYERLQPPAHPTVQVPQNHPRLNQMKIPDPSS